jgi:hypothetical protein
MIMMDFSEAQRNALREACIHRFGEEEGQKVYEGLKEAVGYIGCVQYCELAN